MPGQVEDREASPYEDLKNLFTFQNGMLSKQSDTLQAIEAKLASSTGEKWTGNNIALGSTPAQLAAYDRKRIEAIVQVPATIPGAASITNDVSLSIPFSSINGSQFLAADRTRQNTYLFNNTNAGITLADANGRTITYVPNGSGITLAYNGALSATGGPTSGNVFITAQSIIPNTQSGGVYIGTSQTVRAGGGFWLAPGGSLTIKSVHEIVGWAPSGGTSPVWVCLSFVRVEDN